ncbi:MAG: hypothetical protein ABEK16_02400 [Candidatus Nanohalobium sp.]
MKGENSQSLEEFEGAFPEIGEVVEQLKQEREEFEMRDFKLESIKCKWKS